MRSAASAPGCSEATDRLAGDRCRGWTVSAAGPIWLRLRRSASGSGGCPGCLPVRTAGSVACARACASHRLAPWNRPSPAGCRRGEGSRGVAGSSKGGGHSSVPSSAVHNAPGSRPPARSFSMSSRGHRTVSFVGTAPSRSSPWSSPRQHSKRCGTRACARAAGGSGLSTNAVQEYSTGRGYRDHRAGPHRLRINHPGDEAASATTGARRLATPTEVAAYLQVRVRTPYTWRYQRKAL